MGLELRNVDQAYGKQPVLRGVSLTVADNEIVGLLGHNGAGKSTILRTISGLTGIRKGSINYNNESIVGRSPSTIVRRGIAYAPQGGSIFSNLTVLENLELGGYTLRSKEEAARNTARILALFENLAARRDVRAGSLSGGERQMLGVGIALMASPSLLMVDEPSGALAPALVTRLFNHIVDINREMKVGVLIVEQNTEETLRIANRVYVLAHGSITYKGETADKNIAQDVGKRLLGI